MSVNNKILLVGLGNPGEKYQHNRHNVGFMFVDYIVNKVHGSQSTVHGNIPSFTFNKYLLSDVCELRTMNSELVVAKPQTYMNRSGDAVARLISNFKFKISNLVVIHDELDIPLGDFKINKSGNALHNGVTSIEQALHVTDFLRVRIGVDARTSENRMLGEAYVLSDFLPEEQKTLFETFPKVYERLLTMLKNPPSS